MDKMDQQTECIHISSDEDITNNGDGKSTQYMDDTTTGENSSEPTIIISELEWRAYIDNTRKRIGLAEKESWETTNSDVGVVIKMTDAWTEIMEWESSEEENDEEKGKQF